MAFTIKSAIGSGMTGAAGRSTQAHVVCCPNQGVYLLHYLSSTQSLSALYAADPAGSWTAPTGSPFALVSPHQSDGRLFGFGYANLASTDVIHMASMYTGTTFNYHTRFTLTAASPLAWNAGTEAAWGASVPLTGSRGCAIAYSSDAHIWQAGTSNAPAAFARISANADAGTSWTAGSGTATNQQSGVVSSHFLASLGSNQMIWIGDNNGAAQTFTQLSYNTFNGTTWGTVGSALAGTVTSADTAAWGAVGRTTSDIHVVALSDNSSAYVHRRFNGTIWSDGDAIPTLAYGTASGVSLVTDGTFVWAFVADTSKNIEYCKWTSGSGWGSWTTLEATRTDTPSYINAVYSAARSEVLAYWTETTAAPDKNIVGSSLPTGAAPTSATIAGSSTGTISVESGAITVTLNVAAGIGGVVVNLASSDGSDVFHATQGGSSVASFTIAQGQTTGNFYLVPSSAVGTHTITPTATGITFSPTTWSYSATAAASAVIWPPFPSIPAAFLTM